MAVDHDRRWVGVASELQCRKASGFGVTDLVAPAASGVWVNGVSCRLGVATGHIIMALGFEVENSGRTSFMLGAGPLGGFSARCLVVVAKLKVKREGISGYLGGGPMPTRSRRRVHPVWSAFLFSPAFGCSLSDCLPGPDSADDVVGPSDDPGRAAATAAAAAAAVRPSSRGNAVVARPTSLGHAATVHPPCLGRAAVARHPVPCPTSRLLSLLIGPVWCPEVGSALFPLDPPPPAGTRP